MGALQSFPEGAVERLAPLLQQAHTKAAYQRVQAVWLRAMLGFSAAQIAQVLGWQAQSVRQWHSESFRHGEAVHKDKPQGGRHHQNVTLQQEQALLTPFLAQAQAGGVLVGAPVQAAYEQAVGRPVCPAGGWGAASPRLAPDHAASETPEGERRGARSFPPKWPEVVQEQVTAQDQRLPVRVMFEDEARFGRIHAPRRCGAPAGVRPAVNTRIVREYEYAFAAVSPHEGALDPLVWPSVKAEARSVFLAEVSQRHAHEFLLMGLDGAGWHRAKRLQVASNMKLIPLPAWSPPRNPVEQLWDEVREKWLANRVFGSLSALEEQ